MRCRAGVGDKKEESQNPCLTISLTQTYLDREGGGTTLHYTFWGLKNRMDICYFKILQALAYLGPGLRTFLVGPTLCL